MTKQKQDKKSKIKARAWPSRPRRPRRAAPRASAAARQWRPWPGGRSRSLADPAAAVVAQAFIKTVNYNHMMPTRYVLDLELKGAVTSESTESTTKKVAAGKEAKKLLEERYKTGKNRWVFTKLRF
jgi:hypothetical protein